MSLVQRIGDFNRVLQDLLDRQRTFQQARGQRVSFQILHHQKINSVLPADVVQRANVRMIQSGDGSRLALEALAGFRPVGQMRGQAP